MLCYYFLYLVEVTYQTKKLLFMPSYTLNVNGETHTVTASEDSPILWVLRDQLNLVGTKFGCGIAQCGACTIHLDGSAVRSCMLTVSQVDGKSIKTIEGLSEDGSHPVQVAWKEIDVPQCGYCQAGQIMTASAFLSKNADPSEEQIKSAMHGNICRCASYLRIEKAVKKAAENMI